MKRNGILLIAALVLFFVAGQTMSAGIAITAQSPQASGGSIDGSSAFSIDIYINNDSGTDLTGGSLSLGFSSPDGSIVDITHVDAAIPTTNVPSWEPLGSYASYFFLTVHMDSTEYMTGNLPHYVNVAPAGFVGMPTGLGALASMRFNMQAFNSTTGTTGQLCVDSISSAQTLGVQDWDWLFPDELLPITFNGPYCWTITNLSISDVTQISNPTENLPTDFSLEQNYPNPFNPSTTFDFSLPKQSLVKIDIFNVLGQKITTLADGEYEAGKYSVTWDGTDEDGSSAATGIYFYRMNAGDFQATKKLMLLK